MAFWGIEVKPGKPFTQKFDDFKGRLHVSLATLGFGKATSKSILQCNVGNKSPVFLCSLLPEKTECLQLNLEYEEADEVVFSVIGPRSIHLSGYFLQNCRHTLNDDTESYGEDIANTDTQSSEYGDEDKYEDSFINDDAEPEACPPSPILKEEEETSHKKKTRKKKRSQRRLRKSYHLSDSDNDEASQHTHISNKAISALESESLDEDNLPISSWKNKTNGENPAQETEVGESKVIHESSDIETKFNGDSSSEIKGKTDCDMEDDQPNGNESEERNNFPVLANGVYPENVEEPKKLIETEGNTCQALMMISSKDIIEEAVVEKNEATIHEMGHEQKHKKKRKLRSEIKPVEVGGKNENYVPLGVEAHEEELKTGNTVNNSGEEANPGADLLDSSIMVSADAGSEDIERPKKKKKKSSEQGKVIECDGADDLKPEKMDQDVQPAPDGCTIEDHSTETKVTKKKKSKLPENMVSSTSDISPFSSGEEKPSPSVIKDKECNDDTMSSEVRTLPEGLVIEELVAGKLNGKIATPGKKISVLYVGKLKETGKIIDSTGDGTPYKFRFGVGRVIDGWEAGLDGMRVGEKRRLTVPPSMGYGSKGDGENIPPDSWLVYEVELVKVH